MRSARIRRVGAAAIALAATLVATPGIAKGQGAGLTPDVAVKAALIFNFAKFTEWPTLPPASSLVICVMDGGALGAALAETVHGQHAGGHVIEVQHPKDSAAWWPCQVLFIADAERRRVASGLAGIQTLPVLTVSDGKDFSLAGGIIELYVESARIRFAINMDAAQRSALRISSRLLGLAKIVK